MSPDPRGELNLYLAETRQLFDSLDPAPFRERDLDPKADAYVVDWAREAPARIPLRLVVHLGRETATEATTAVLREAVDDHFRRRAQATWARLRRLFREGRIAGLIGFGFLLAAIVVGDWIASRVASERYAIVIQESLIILGWVAIWRPMGIFLYDWWPIRAEARLLDRLAEMDVKVVDASRPAAGATDRPVA
ncbi:MAG TPA: hypothetical protein VFM45_01650 [Anaeromyxobacteraceae bacterium]|nr:hypothetical protein [Anaeromyxobacteraceae bacterium]